MARQWLHCLDQDGLHVFAAGQGNLRPMASFPPSEDGVAQFRRWLQDEKIGGLHTLLADLPDEGFHSESVPYATGQDRRALLQRRMTQHFFGTPYTTALSLGRESSGRRDERIVFAAITRPAAVEPWLATMHAHPLAVSALLTPALLLRPLLASLRSERPRGLLIALSHTGIRQIYFEEGRLRFARLSPAPEGPFSRWAPDCLREAQKTYQYLSAQRWLPRGSSLPVGVLLHPDDIAPFMADLASADTLDFQALNLVSVIQRCGLRLRVSSSDSRPLFMHLALRDQGRQQLAPESDRRFFRQWQVRTAALAVGAVAFAAAAVLALKLQVDSAALRDLTAEFRSQETRANQRYQALLQTLPNMPADLEQLNTVVEGYERLMARQQGPQPALLHLSRVLDRFTDVELQRVDWQVDDKDADILQQVQPPQIIAIAARLPLTASNDPRTAITRIRAFASALQEQGGGKVTLSKQPFDVESDKVLRGTADNKAEPAFELLWALPGADT